MRCVSCLTSSPLMIGLMPQESSAVEVEKIATRATAWREFFRNLREPAHEALDQRRGGDDIAANDDHHHLHGERNQRPEALAALDREVHRLLAGRDANQKNDDDAGQREDQRIGKPALGPVGKSDTEALQSQESPRVIFH